MRSQRDGFATILVLLVVVLVGGVGVGWYLSQKGIVPKFSAPATSEQPPAPPPVPGGDSSPAPTGAGETANWKTYTNGEFKFSLKYPVGMKVYSSMWDRIGNDEKGQWGLEISDRKDGDITGASIKEQVNVAVFPHPKTGYGTPITKIEDSILGVEPSYYKLQGYSAAKFNIDNATVIHILKGESLWILRGSDQILSTFKFLP